MAAIEQYDELKRRHRAMWASGDYPRMVETFLLPLGSRLVDACGVGPEDRVLDVATGTGNAAVPAAERGAHVIATDLTPEILDAGRARTDDRLGIQWVTADAEHLPFAAESFDLVMSSIGVMFAPHHQAAADELVRVCRPGGTIGLLSWTPEGMLGALFATMRPFAPPPAAAGRPAATAVGQRRPPGHALRRPRHVRNPAPRRPRNHRVHRRARLRRALQGLLRADDQRPSQRRTQRTRARIRCRARRVLRRVEPRNRRSCTVRQGVLAGRRHPAMRPADRPVQCVSMTSRLAKKPCSPRVQVRPFSSETHVKPSRSQLVP